MLRWTLSARCTRGVCFGVLVQCTSPSEAIPIADELRHSVEVAYTSPLPEEAHESRNRKLLRRFVTGIETIVVLADPSLVPVQGWDERLVSSMSGRKGKERILTCPQSRHAVGYPTLRKRSNGDIVRSDAAEMAEMDSKGSVPSACWCQEFTAAEPRLLSCLWKKKKECEQARFYVPTYPILVPDAKREERILALSEQPLGGSLTPPHSLGLTEGAGVQEMYHKFGSASSARLAVKLEKRKM